MIDLKHVLYKEEGKEGKGREMNRDNVKSLLLLHFELEVTKSKF